jgi:nucleoside-diphosphate-sugar epimerase
MYIDDCITGIEKLMRSSYSDPLNLGRSELVSINQLADMIQAIAGVEVRRRYNLDAPQGVRGRNSDNTLIKQVLGWEPEIDLHTGLKKTYVWVKEQYERRLRGEHTVE